MKELLKSLRYFQRQSNEINRTKLIYIQENIDYKIFKNFITSINTKEISLDESNYESYYELSCKYEYQELQEQIESFIATRPDIFPIVDQLSQEKAAQNSSTYKKIDYLKEEIIAKHLELSLKNGSLKKFPIENLIRILNSPKRQIEDHHLLYSFVFEYLKEMKNRELNDTERENLLILPSCLDFSELENDEIDELFDLEESMQMLLPRGTKQRMKKFIENERKMNERISQIEKQIQIIQLNSNKEIDKINKNQEKIRSEIDEQIMKIKSNEEEIVMKQKTNELKIENLEKNVVSNSNARLDRIKLQIDEYDKKFIQNEKIINEIQTKMIEKINKQNKQNLELNKSLKNEQLHHKNEIEKHQHLLINLQNIIARFWCQNGVFQYLFNKYDKNPVDQRMIKISGSSMNEFNEEILKNIIDPLWKTNWWISQNEENSSIKIEFHDFCVKIDKYRLRIGTDIGNYIFKSWILNGTTEDNKEIILSEVENSDKVTKQQTEITVDIQNDLFIKSISLTMKGKNSNDRFDLILRNIEIFGLISENSNT